MLNGIPPPTSLADNGAAADAAEQRRNISAAAAVAAAAVSAAVDTVEAQAAPSGQGQQQQEPVAADATAELLAPETTLFAQGLPLAEGVADPAAPAAESTPAENAEAGAIVLQPNDANEQAMWDWLESLDGGRGTLLQYFGAIKTEFDADFTQISAARLPEPMSAGTLGSIEPTFFEALGVRQVGHKLLLARGIMALPAP